MQRYKESVARTPHLDVPLEFRRIRIDYNGLIDLAKSKGVSVPDLSDEEKNQFILNSSVAQINQLRRQYGF